MKVHCSTSVCLADLLVVDFGKPVVGGDSTTVGENETTDGVVDSTVLLYSPVLCAKVAVDDVLVVDKGLLCLSDILMLLSVEDVCLCNIFIASLGEDGLDSILDIFDCDLSVLYLL